VLNCPFSRRTPDSDRDTTPILCITLRRRLLPLQGVEFFFGADELGSTVTARRFALHMLIRLPVTSLVHPRFVANVRGPSEMISQRLFLRTQIP